MSVLSQFEIGQCDPAVIENYLNKHQFLVEELGARQAELDHIVHEIGQLEGLDDQRLEAITQEAQVLMDRWNLLSETLNFQMGTALHLLHLLRLQQQASHPASPPEHQEEPDRPQHSTDNSDPSHIPAWTKPEVRPISKIRVESLTFDLLNSLETVPNKLFVQS